MTEALSIQVNYVDATPDVLIEIETPPVPPSSPQLNEVYEEFTAILGQTTVTLAPRSIPYLVTLVEVNGIDQVEGVNYSVNYVTDVITFGAPLAAADLVVVTVLELPM
jgi:hypothetical protein